jgi:Nickel/cobalt transporter regulator
LSRHRLSSPGGGDRVRIVAALWLTLATASGAAATGFEPPSRATSSDELPGRAPTDLRSHPVRGGFLPTERLADRITDPRRYKVRPAPPGYSWVHVGRDLFLIQDRSGLIVDTVEGGYN